MQPQAKQLAAALQEEDSLPDGGAAKHVKAEVAEAAGAAAAAERASTSSEGDSHSEDGGAAAAAGGGAAGAGSGKPKRQRKIPKLPMVRHGKKWYRARLLKEAAARVQLGALRPVLRYCSAQQHLIQHFKPRVLLHCRCCFAVRCTACALLEAYIDCS